MSTIVRFDKDVISQLTDIYLSDAEWWHERKLTEEDAKRYFRKLFLQGNIVYYLSELDNELLGYVESWRINFEQFGRLVCHAPFSAYNENVTGGNIAYLANTWIKPEHRRTNVYRVLRLKFFTANYNCEYFVGRALRKKTQPIKVLTRSQINKGA
jgi:ribosomal protein S18 acetylase RimI-like enzyme